MILELQLPKDFTPHHPPRPDLFSTPGVRCHQQEVPELCGHFLFSVTLSAHLLKRIKTGIRITGFPMPPGCSQALANGWQCWSESPILKSDETLLADTKRERQVFGDAEFYSYAEVPGEFHSWGYSYGSRSEGDGAPFWGSLTEFTAHSAFTFQLQRCRYGIYVDTEELNTDNELTLSWILPHQDATAFASLTQSQSVWIKELTQSPTAPKVNPEKVFGYTSWYYTYTDISADLLTQRLTAITAQKAPWSVFQVDDGFSTAIGDWTNLKSSFPKGMAHIASQAKDEGRRPGLWCAPFIAGENSRLFAEHPEYFLRDRSGKLVLCGEQPLWGGGFYALDTENPAVKKHLESVFHTYFHHWGFSFLKADFLYAASRIAVGGRTRAQRGRRAMEWLWDICEKYNVTLLACGSVLSTSVGVCHYCRVGADVDMYFTPEENPQWDVSHPMREIPSTVGTLTNTITRSPLNGLSFGNDPDVFILREQAQHMTREQRKLIYEVNKLFGNLLFCSDDPAAYAGWQKDNMLQTAPLVQIQEILKLIKQDKGVYTIRVKDNQDKTYDLTVNLSSYSRQGEDAEAIKMEEVI